MICLICVAYSLYRMSENGSASRKSGAFFIGVMCGEVMHFSVLAL